MKGIITYDKDGVSCIRQFDLALSNTESEVLTTMHRHDVWEQVGQYIKDNIKEHDSLMNIGYKMSVMPKFESRLDNLQIRRGEEWESILYRSFKEKIS
jgi:hypothetical protein